MRKASQKDKIYQCFYDPVEPGIYTVHVQWSGIHINGSPFSVLLATSARELQLMQEELQENSIIAGDDSSIVMNRRSRSRSPQPVSMEDRVFVDQVKSLLVKIKPSNIQLIYHLYLHLISFIHIIDAVVVDIYFCIPFSPCYF